MSNFKRDGIARLGSVFNTSQLTAVHDWLKDLADHGRNVADSYQPTFEPGGEGFALRKVRRLFWNDPPFWTEQLRASGIADIATKVVGGPVALTFHAAFLKPASVGTPVVLHQDQFLWDHDYPKAVNIWIAITPSRIQNGCLVGCPGSHLLGPLRHDPVPNHPWHPGIDWEACRLNRPIPYPLEAGEGLIWDRWFVHGSGANSSPQPRWGVVMAFVDRSRPDLIAIDQVNLDAPFSTISGHYAQTG